MIKIKNFGEKVRAWNSRFLIRELRKNWADLANEHLSKAGYDVRIEREQWPALKSTMPTGQLPVLEVHENGNVFKLSQSIAIGI